MSEAFTKVVRTVALAIALTWLYLALVPHVPAGLWPAIPALVVIPVMIVEYRERKAQKAKTKALEDEWREFIESLPGK